MSPDKEKDRKRAQIIVLSQSLRNLEELYRGKAAAFSNRIKKEKRAP
jgi:hypothetical protein